MRSNLMLVAAILCVTACGERPSLQIGQTMEGALDSADQVSADGPYEDRWTFDLRAGQRIRLEMRSETLDSYLRMMGPDGQLVATNDDAMGRDAAITVRGAATGRYTAVATSYGRERARGTYGISLVEVPGGFADPGAVVAIAVGESKEGVLEVGDSTTASRGYADYFDLRAAAAGGVVIDLTSTQLDPYLVLRDTAGQQLAMDDDSGEDRNARLSYAVAAGARYRVVATTFGTGARSGAYRLAVRPEAP